MEQLNRSLQKKKTKWCNAYYGWKDEQKAKHKNKNDKAKKFKICNNKSKLIA